MVYLTLAIALAEHEIEFSPLIPLPEESWTTHASSQIPIPIPMPRFLHSSFSSNSTRPVRIARRRGDRLRSPADGPQSIMIWSEEIVRNASVVGFRLSAFSFLKELFTSLNEAQYDVNRILSLH